MNAPFAVLWFDPAVTYADIACGRANFARINPSLYSRFEAEADAKRKLRRFAPMIPLVKGPRGGLRPIAGCGNLRRYLPKSPPRSR